MLYYTTNTVNALRANCQMACCVDVIYTCALLYEATYSNEAIANLTGWLAL